MNFQTWRSHFRERWTPYLRRESQSIQDIEVLANLDVMAYNRRYNLHTLKHILNTVHNTIETQLDCLQLRKIYRIVLFQNSLPRMIKESMDL